MTTKRNMLIYPYIIIIIEILHMSIAAHGQNIKNNNWQHFDLQIDSVYGISADRAYAELLKGKIGVSVTVAVIDGGLDTSHKAFRGILWRNPKEIAGNGKDDDHNGYTDDLHGWNFLGSNRGSFQYDNLDLVRQIRVAVKMGNHKQEAKLQWQLEQKRNSWQHIRETSKIDLGLLKRILTGIGKSEPVEKDFRAYRYKIPAEQQLLLRIVTALKQGQDFNSFRNYLEWRYQDAKEQLDYWLNLEYDPRKDQAFSRPFYGNGDIQGPIADHATHVAGIISAKSTGGKEDAKGVAHNVKLMILRTVPIGDFLDAEMALAIRYAADNGAKIINISIGKGMVLDPGLIEASIKYAMDKDVLIVHAAGNQGKLLEQGVYPKKNYQNGGWAKAWIEVGASGSKDDASLLFGASNYGKAVVDVFAPGVEINSCAPGNSYMYLSGTSMATPVVSGMAAVVRSYYPQLSALQVRQVILESVSKVSHPVKTADGKMIPFSETCASAGIVNLYSAIQLADKMTGAKLPKEGK
jgi:subtilisin family serine protease